MAASTSALLLLLLLLATLAACEASCPTGVTCTIASAVEGVDPEVSASLNLLQVSLTVQEGHDARKASLAANKTSGSNATAWKQPKWGKAPWMQDLPLLVTLDAYSPAILALRNKFSHAILGCMMVGTLLSVCCLASSDGPWTIRPRSRLSDDGPSEVWTKHRNLKVSPDRLLALFEELDEVEQSEDSPPGFISRSDLNLAMQDPRIIDAFAELGITMHDSSTVFTLLDADGSGLVHWRHFCLGCVDMGARFS
jgi:hypothetical protein